MKSPFPGMDPYLELHWKDVQHSITTYAADDLQRQLPKDLRASFTRRLIRRSIMDEDRAIFPTQRTIQHGFSRDTPNANPPIHTAVGTPLIITLGGTFESQPVVDIIKEDSRAVITTIDFLSPADKFDGGRAQYLERQRYLHGTQINVVAIDLLRAGRRVLMIPEVQIPKEARKDYFACVSRGHRRNTVELYSVSLREKLPTIRIPLRQEEADVFLDIQALLDQAYRTGRYDRTDYTGHCIPPLEDADAAWADELLKHAGRR